MQFSLDLESAARRLAANRMLNPSEAVASLLAGLLAWNPTCLHLNTWDGLTVGATGLHRSPDMLELISARFLSNTVDWVADHLCLGLHSLLQKARSVTFHCTIPAHSLCLRDPIEAQWPLAPRWPRHLPCPPRLDAHWRLSPAPPLDLACLRRRFLKCHVPLLINGQPLLQHALQPSTLEYLWESHDLHLPAPDQGFAAASLGYAGLELGQDLGQPLLLKKKHTLILGRDFDGPARKTPPLYQLERPESISLFRSGIGHWASVPRCTSCAALQLRTRHATRVFAVVHGFTLDPLEFPDWEPGWRIWVPSPAHNLSPDLRSLVRPEVLLQRAAESLARAQKRLQPHQANLLKSLPR